MVRDTAAGTVERLAVLDRSVAQAMALKDWIHCAAPGRVSRYAITAAGRAELNRLLVQAEGGAGRGPGMAEDAAGQQRLDRITTLIAEAPDEEAIKAMCAQAKVIISTVGPYALFGEILVPTEEVVEIKGGQKRKSERKFFPGYVLVQMEMCLQQN